MIILQPSVAFPIVRQIANHTDSTSYYVRAVIRDADGTIIDTVNLADQGSQRYQNLWKVVVDKTGAGRYISIITSVYTDSGYTTKSPNYGDEENTYLIFDRVTPAMRGGGAGVDYYRVRQIIKEELSSVEKPESIDYDRLTPAEQKDRTDELLLALDVMRRQLVDIPKEKTDLAPVLSAISELRNAVEDIFPALEAKEVTPATDLSPVLLALNDLENEVINVRQSTEEQLNAFTEQTTQAMREVEESFGLSQLVSDFNKISSGGNKKLKEPERKPLDLKSLVS